VDHREGRVDLVEVYLMPGFYELVPPDFSRENLTVRRLSLEEGVAPQDQAQSFPK
jgi:hypothetical protein